MPADQHLTGLHHICFRVRSIEDVKKVGAFFHRELEHLGGVMVKDPEDSGGEWAPGYFSTLFEDPDGIRIEVNHVPGQGLLGLQKPELRGAGGTTTSLSANPTAASSSSLTCEPCSAVLKSSEPAAAGR